MNLQELRITKDIKQSGLDQLKLVIKNNGWKILGFGAEGIVAEHPNKKYVLKIYKNTSKYTKFVEYVQKNQNNPHLPKFSRFVKKVPGTRYNYIRMEKLTELIDIESYLPEFVYLYLVGMQSNCLALCANILLMVERFFEKNFFQYLPNYTSNNNMFRKIENADIEKVMQSLYRQPDEEWKQVCVDLVKITLYFGKRRLDVGGNNVMLRGKTLVITDPFF